MKNEFDYLSLHTEYQCSGVKSNWNSTPCFRDVFIRDGLKNADYKIRMYKPGEALTKNKWNNACFASLEIIKHHASLLEQLFPIKYEVEEVDEGLPHYLVKLSIRDKKNIYHRYALSWMRYLYEYPGNMILSDAYRLKKEVGFKRMSIANLFILCAACINGDESGFRFDQTITKYGKPLTMKELGDRLSHCTQLSDIYYRDGSERWYTSGVITQIKGNIRNIDYWVSEEEFKKRKECYVKTYKEARKLHGKK